MHFLQLLVIFVSLFFPHPHPEKPVLLLNGTAHTGNGHTIDNAALAFQEGRITMIGDATRIRLDLSAFQVRKIYGKHIYAAVLADSNSFSARDSLYAVALGTDELVVNVSRPALEAGQDATLIVTDRAIDTKGKPKVVMAFVNGREVFPQEKHLRQRK